MYSWNHFIVKLTDLFEDAVDLDSDPYTHMKPGQTRNQYTEALKYETFHHYINQDNEEYPDEQATDLLEGWCGDFGIQFKMASGDWV